MKQLSAAYVRGYASRTGTPALPEELRCKPLRALGEEENTLLLQAGKQAGLKLYRFKDHGELPRVQKVLGFLRGVWPESLLDVGSGRGVFLFPFLCTFPDTPVTSVDLLDYRVEFLQDIQRGGISQLNAVQQNICDMSEGAYDVVTLLEVLEHIPQVEQAVQAAVRLAKRYVVVTVPSKPDNNPEHIHLLTKDVLTEMFNRAGCTRLSFDGVPGHLFLVASVPLK